MQQPLDEWRLSLDNPRLRAMSRLVRRLSFAFTALVTATYIGLNLAALYADDWLSEPIAAGALTSRAIVIATLIIIAGVALTAVFVWIINNRLDRLRAEIAAELADQAEPKDRP